MAPPPEIKLEIVLDPAVTRYFPGDEISGKIFFTSNQSCTIRNMRIAWTGAIQVQPIQTNRDTRTYFNECWKFNEIIKPNSRKSNVYQTEMVGVNVNTYESKLDLHKNKTVGLAFKVYVPNDQPLPSCTETGALPNKIMYLLKAYLEENGKQQFYTQLLVPVYEYIFSRTPDMLQPKRVEQVFVVSSNRTEFTSGMRVTLPFRGSQPGTELPISVTIWNSMAFSRKQGISISLLRITEVQANGRTYASQGEKVHRVVTDLNITTNDPDQNKKVQTLRIKFPIPKGITPTISFESSQLLSITYFIRVQAFAQEGVYTNLEGAKSQFMMLELPLTVCTKSTPPDSNLSPVSSPTLSFTRLPSNHSGIFRSLSNGSSSTTSDKTASFSTLNPVVVMAAKGGDDTRTISSFQMYNDSSLLGLASSLSRNSSSGSRAGVDEIEGHINDIINSFSNKTLEQPEKTLEQPIVEQQPIVKEKGGGRVFQMFDDDDDSDEEEELPPPPPVQAPVSREQFDKPHTKQDFVYKPNTVDSDSFDETEEEEADEFDLLGVLARHENKGTKIA